MHPLFRLVVTVCTIKQYAPQPYGVFSCFHSEGVRPHKVLKLRKNVFSLVNPEASATCDIRIVGSLSISSWA